jgi:DNA-binding transcriptional MerR regulator
LEQNFSIQDLAQLSGIKAHTIRIWEQRYELLNPSRTEGNVRIYSNEDLRLLLNVVILRKNGMKISKIASMSEGDIAGTALELSRSHLEPSSRINTLISQMLSLDELGFERTLELEMLNRGFERSIREIVFPFLEQLGLLWTAGVIKPGHEHFVSGLIRRKLIAGVEGYTSSPAIDSKLFLLYLPEGENHELSLLFLQYMLKSRGQRVIYLGANMPLDHLIDLVKTSNADWVYSIVTSISNGFDLNSYTEKLCSSLPEQKIALSGNMVHGLSKDLPEQLHVLKDLNEVLNFVDGFVARS